MNPIIKIIAWLTLLICSHAFAQSQQTIQRSYTFKQLGITGSAALKGSESQLYIGFGSRLDEVVTAAEVNVDFIPSPSLIAQASHIKVFLNYELMGVIAINADRLGQSINANIPLDPRFISNYNQVHFELIGTADKSCQDPNDPSIWSEISSSSSINLTVIKTDINNELSLFPAPFFDERDLGDLTLPLVIPQEFQLEELKAAGIFASYFGALADWRKQAYPIYRELPPQQHAIVFATNAYKPDFIKNLPEIKTPAVQIISHPDNSKKKLLLVLGKDAQQLNQAVRGLVLGNSLMAGEMAEVINYQSLSQRRPYDAPRWLNTSRAVTFSELAQHKYQLQTKGVNPAPINISFKLPPDLFTWQSSGVPLDLKFRYSPAPNDAGGAKLTVLVNNIYLQAINMDSSGIHRPIDISRVPLLGQALIAFGPDINIPGFRVGQVNNFSFDFGFSSVTQGRCVGRQPSIHYAVIDDDSSIDFSDFPHYIKMPNLAVFANAGYPFTRLADLSETLVVMTQKPSKKEIDLFIHVMATMGKQTGLAAYNVEVENNFSAKNAANKDVLVIVKEGDKIFDSTVNPMIFDAISDNERKILRPLSSKKTDPRFIAGSTDPLPVTQEIVVKSRGSFATIISFESPITPKRSVVVMSAGKADDFQLIKDSLSADNHPAIFGSLVTIRRGNIDSYEVGKTYFVGHLPIHQLLWFHFSDKPLFVAFIAILLVTIISVLIWRALRIIARRRLQNKDD